MTYDNGNVYRDPESGRAWRWVIFDDHPREAERVQLAALRKEEP